MLTLRLFKDGDYQVESNNTVISEGSWNADTEAELIEEIKQRAVNSNQKFDVVK